MISWRAATDIGGVNNYQVILLLVIAILHAMQNAFLLFLWPADKFTGCPFYSPSIYPFTVRHVTCYTHSIVLRGNFGIAHIPRMHVQQTWYSPHKHDQKLGELADRRVINGLLHAVQRCIPSIMSSGSRDKSYNGFRRLCVCMKGAGLIPYQYQTLCDCVCCLIPDVVLCGLII